jgi:RNA polymerase sigma-70 factor (ECF subfamily)
LRVLFDTYYQRLLSDVYRVIRDEDACKDIVQDVFVDFWNKRESIEVHTSLQAYLRRAAVNKALNYLKNSRRFVLEEDGVVFDSTEYPDALDSGDALSAEQLEQNLHRAIEALPEKCRLVFSMSRFDHLSHKEIAETLGISVKTIENQITKAMKMLRESLSRNAHLSPIVILLLNMGLGA